MGGEGNTKTKGNELKIGPGSLSPREWSDSASSESDALHTHASRFPAAIGPRLVPESTDAWGWGRPVDQPKDLNMGEEKDDSAAADRQGSGAFRPLWIRPKCTGSSASLHMNRRLPSGGGRRGGGRQYLGLLKKRKALLFIFLLKPQYYSVYYFVYQSSP